MVYTWSTNKTVPPPSPCGSIAPLSLSCPTPTHPYIPPLLSVLSRKFQGTLNTERKFAAGENKSSHQGHMNMKKLDDETEEFQRECFSFGWALPGKGFLLLFSESLY